VNLTVFYNKKKRLHKIRIKLIKNKLRTRLFNWSKFNFQLTILNL